MIRKNRDPIKKKKISTKISPVRTRIVPVKSRSVEKILVENFVSLQKVMTTLSFKFDNLASQISKLLELFEISAKNLAHKDFGLEKEGKDNKEVIAKLDNLLGQNKIIAKGLTLMHEANPHQLNRPQHAKNLIVKRKIFHRQHPAESDEYQRSMSSNQNDAPPKP